MDYLVARVKADLTQSLSKISTTARVNNIRILREQTKSDIFVCAIDGLDINLIVKTIKESPSSYSVESQAKLECDALKCLYSIDIGNDCHLCPKV